MAEELQSSIKNLSEQILRLQARLSDLGWAPAARSSHEPVAVVKVHTFDSADADLIIKSSDGIEFRVFKRILSEGSIFFQTMFTLPTDGTSERTPTVDITESSPIISTLLQFLYPVPDPAVKSLGELNDLIAVAIKYDMHGVQHSLRKLLVSQSFVASDPFAAFTIALRHQLVEEIKIIAGWTFSVSLLDMPLTDDHRYITGFEFFQLLKLHRRRAKEFIDTIKSFAPAIKCPGCSRRNDDQSTNWWKDWEARAFFEILNRPCTKIVFSPAFIAKSAKAVIENTSPCFECPLHMLSSQTSLETLRIKLDSLAIVL
jgi:BTB/POZ domain